MDLNQTYKAAFDLNPDAIVILNGAGKIMLANKQAENVFGYSANEMLGQAIEILIPEGWITGTQVEVQHQPTPPVTEVNEEPFDFFARKKDGTGLPIEISFSKILLEEDQLTAAAIRVVTKRKEIEKKLMESEERYRTTLDNMLEGACILDRDYRYVYVNKAFARQSRCSVDDLLGRILIEKFPWVKESDFFKVYQQCMTERISKHIDIKFTFPDGVTGWFELSVQPVPEGIFVVSMDITDRKKAEEELVRQKKFTEDILNHIPADIAVFDAQHHYVFLNPKAISDEATRKWLIGKDDFDYVRFRGIDESLAVKRRALFQEVVRTGMDLDWLDEHKNPEETKYILRRFHPFFERGQLQYVIGYGIDVTETKKTESKLEEILLDLKEANKELEQFAYMVSHDLQEPLRMVTGFLNLLKIEMPELLQESTAEYIHHALDGANRMKKMIQDLLHFSRVGTNKEDFDEVNLNEVMLYVTQVLQEKINETGAVLSMENLPVVIGIKTLLNQLLMNLVGNALKYYGNEKPEIKIGVAEEKDHWLFHVSDNGIGIDPKFFDKIFGIFQRLHSKDEFSGTGIGLAICKKIVEKHGGQIWLTSTPNQGSTFYFTLPKRIIHAQQDITG